LYEHIRKFIENDCEGGNGVLKEQGLSCEVDVTPEFRVAVQSITEDGVHIIIHANGHNSDTLDFIVSGDELQLLNT
jgi:hypothetical protein